MNLSNLLTAGRIAAAACLLGALFGFYDLEWGHQLDKTLAVSFIAGGLTGLGGGAYGASQVRAAVRALTAEGVKR